MNEELAKNNSENKNLIIENNKFQIQMKENEEFNSSLNNKHSESNQTLLKKNGYLENQLNETFEKLNDLR